MLNLIAMLKATWYQSRKYAFIVALQNFIAAIPPLLDVVGVGLIVDVLLRGATQAQVLFIIIFVVATHFILSATQSILTYFGNIEMRKKSNDVQNSFMEDTQKINYHYIADGTLFNLRGRAMWAHPVFYINHLGSFLGNVIRLMGLITIFIWLSPLFLLILSITIIIGTWLMFKTKEKEYDFRNSRQDDDRRIDYLYKVMTEYRFGKEVRVNKANTFVHGYYQGVVSTLMKKIKSYNLQLIKIGWGKFLIVAIQSICMYIFFSYQVAAGQISIAEYVLLLGAVTLTASVFLSMSENLATIKISMRDVTSNVEYLQLLEDKSDIIKSNNLPLVTIDRGTIEVRFESVTFRYPGSDTDVLKNISFAFGSTTMLGLVGLNGAGKSTIVKLLARLYNPDAGRITLNGIDIRTIPLDDYMGMIGVVLQDFFLFSFSIRENMTFGHIADDVALLKALKESGLEDKLGKLEHGLDTSVYKTLDDNGIEFSGGEGQKLAMARTVYANTDILILDEPTSALDPIAEYALFKKLGTLAKGKASLFISHRLSSTRFCDSIIVLEDGEVIESGSHVTLMEKGGVYAKLFETQAQYYNERE